MPRALKCDRVLCATILALVFVGLIMVFSATTGRADGTLKFGVKQMAAALVGIAAMRVLMYVDYRRFRKPKMIILALGSVVALLGMVLLGSETAGTLRFLRLWIFSIQPSELAKLALVLFLAFSWKSAPIGCMNGVRWRPPVSCWPVCAGLSSRAATWGRPFLCL